MMNKTAAKIVKREHVVVRVMRRGLDVFHHLHGPFTEAEANVYAMHGNTYGRNEEYYVQDIQPIEHHEKWIIKSAHTGG
jgi:hypothetical protein